MPEYTVNVDDGWNGYKLGDKATITQLDENDLAVLIKIGVLVPTTKKAEENQSGDIPK